MHSHTQMPVPLLPIEPSQIPGMDLFIVKVSKWNVGTCIFLVVQH
ncbi:hypothetical protein JCM19239_7618 [Vibrio variabilis]|uniref:Uncharacterized protein n=1 Tax=Vibrio variabilis TaxID=990271 RepID=A0ABQ0J4G4_9VIBR|nr:hypothetical protein JCM19239_7618 [Vibrio variabilis]